MQLDMEVKGLDEDYKIITTYNIYKGSKKRIDRHNELRHLKQPEIYDTLVDYYEKDHSINNEPDEEPIPKFLYGSEISNENLFPYLKQHPETSLFIYKKYRNKEFIKDMCDPVSGNPLFIQDVADRLSDYFTYENTSEEMNKLKLELPKIRNDISRYKEERVSLEKEIDEFTRLKDIKKIEFEDVQRLYDHIIDTKSVKLVMDYIKSVSAMANNVLTKASGNELSMGIRTIDREGVENIHTIKNKSEELEKYLKSQEFLSLEKLDEEREKLKVEMELTKNNVDAVIYANPVKKLNKINEYLDRVKDQLDQVKNNKMSEHAHSILTSNINEIIKINNDIQVQIGNVKRKEVKE